MDLVAFVLAQHAATHAAAVGGGPSGADRWLGDLTVAQLRLIPGPGLNSILWLLWHMARTEDVAVNLVVAGRDQVLDAAWMRRMAVSRADMGTGMTAAEVRALTEQADPDAVRAYRAAVGLRTREVVATLPAPAWDEPLGLADTARAAAAGAFGPGDDWAPGVGHPPWQGLPRGAQLGATAIRHNAGHIGEAVTLRALGGSAVGA
jgi:hypothetical protein